MASLFTLSDAEVKAKIEELLGFLAGAVNDPVRIESSQGILALATMYQNELNRRVLEKILKTQTDDE